ncbi:hypothetical protein COV17_01445 [Candidatus Woesearchaeota archaeon CG10_big_fil_rev_8_21_14_0_10_36_11]|nr:MAG: hypothetical protein COV17_01445 [Candidatus Woesearchaeota archaeon CG10_big_fil_rev_8_21_14_0_10_36_11]
MKQSKRAQIHMSETIAVLFIFFILVLFGSVFYYKYSEISFKQQQEEMFAKRAIDTTTKTLFLPELLCSKGESGAEQFCVDMTKLRSAETVFNNNKGYYFGMFSYANITVQQIYPEVVDGGVDTWIVYNNLKPDTTKIEPTYFIVTLKDETHQSEGKPSYGFGVVKVEVYS